MRKLLAAVAVCAGFHLFGVALVFALEFDEACLVLESVRQGRREALATDGLMHAIAVSGFSEPKAGDPVKREGRDDAVWREGTFKDGKLVRVPRREGEQRSRRRGRGPGYVLLSANADKEQILLLEAQGHSAVLAGGAWRTGDPYANNPVPVPVLLKEGRNLFLFAASGRGRTLSASLRVPEKAVFFHPGDITIPDCASGEEYWESSKPGAVIVVNATPEWRRDLSIKAGEVATKCGAVPPLSIRKVGFDIRFSSLIGEVPFFDVELFTDSDVEGEPVDSIKRPARAKRGASATRRVTFVSDIDGSVQYYGLTPAVPAAGTETNPGLVLSLHGASVEAVHQASCYKNKDWVHIVAPTNRRRFGFDWEDWGRTDALEAFNHAAEDLRPDPGRRYLTGHSMGGHGTWQLGAHFPDKFAAIGPSAGWISFWSYAGAMNREEPSAMEKVFLRAASPSDTLALSSNYLHQGVYILHGDADNNVPVAQARTMRSHLSEFHSNFAYYEQPGAGHWWGNRCMDWPRMFEFFKHHTIPDSATVNSIAFKTASPAVSASCHWATVEAQIEPLVTSSIDVGFDAEARQFTGTTKNVARLALDIAHVPAGDPLGIEMDGQKLENVGSPAGTHKIWLSRSGDKWTIVGKPSPKQKGPHRMGPFKEAFQHRMVFVYGTAGTAEENAWALAKARYDAEVFWYRGNGSIDIVPDSDFSLEAYKDRSVILFGNADTNVAWSMLLAHAPLSVSRETIAFGEEKIAGDDLHCLFVYPRADSDVASVGVVSGTGLVGLRATDRLPYFVSGVAYPDYAILRADALLRRSEGVLKAGFFDNDWQIAK